MRRHRFAQAALIAAAVMLTGPTGCAWFQRAQLAKIRQIAPQAAPTDMREQLAATDYSRAVDAIARRDYGRALDYLQAARARQPQDVAVLNAFGVVYDKLGRFDLSARYYAQAQAVEPGSEIVHRNMAYSAMLQGLGSPGAPPTALAASSAAAVEARTTSAAATPAPALKTAIAPPAQAVLTIASAPAPVALLSVAPNGALITGRPLQIVDASGTADKAEAVRNRLVDQGWSAPKTSVSRQAAVQITTLIAYPESSLPVAKALARTLPFPVQLAACQDGCQGLSLIVGSDAVIAARSRS